METGFVSATNTTASASIQGTATNAGLDKNSFLRLLVTQLKNQDPTSTQDPNAMVQQLTSFSNLEQLQNLGSLLQGIQVQNQGLFQAQVSGLVGKRVRVPGDGVELSGGKAAIGVNLGADATSVTLTIKDANGKVVRVLSQDGLKAGSTVVDWDGKDAQGATLPDGDYSVEIAASDSSGKAVAAQTTSYVKVDAVSFKNGVVYLVAGGRTYTLSDVSEIAA